MLEFIMIFCIVMFFIAYSIWINADSKNKFDENKSEKLPPMPYETEEYKKNSAQKQIQQPKKIVPTQIAWNDITDKVQKQGNEYENLTIPFKNRQPLCGKLPFAGAEKPTAYFFQFKQKKYYELHSGDIIRKFPIVGAERTASFYIDKGSCIDESYKDKNGEYILNYSCIIYGAIDSFNKEDGSLEFISRFKFRFKSKKNNEGVRLFLDSVINPDGIDISRNILKYDNGFVRYLFWEVAKYLSSGKNKNEDIVIQKNDVYEPITQSVKKPQKIIQPKKEFTFFPYSVDEIKQKLSDYNSREKTLWELGIEYERFIGYLWESQGYKVIYNGAVKGSADGGIDLIVSSEFTTYLIQCKRWRRGSYINGEEIKKFHHNVKRFKNSNREMIGDNNLSAIFYSTVKFTSDAKKREKRYKIDCQIKEFNVVYEYPSVKCGKTYDGRKFYCLPFDEGFDSIQLHCDRGDNYKFSIDDAEKAGYQYLEYSSFYLT